MKLSEGGIIGVIGGIITVIGVILPWGTAYLTFNLQFYDVSGMQATEGVVVLLCAIGGIALISIRKEGTALGSVGLGALALVICTYVIVTILNFPGGYILFGNLDVQESIGIGLILAVIGSFVLMLGGTFAYTDAKNMMQTQPAIVSPSNVPPNQPPQGSLP